MTDQDQEPEVIDADTGPMLPAQTGGQLPVAQKWDREQVQLIKSLVCQKGTDAELKVFEHVCTRTGLDPFAKQIYAVHRGGKMTIQTGIDGFRLIAHRTQAHAGTDEPVYDTEDGERPGKASVTVYKVVGGQRCPFTATARWDEYYTAQGGFWDRMPYLMLAKCAEALALRKAFPAELSGLYTRDEMGQATNQDKPSFKLDPVKQTQQKQIDSPTKPQTVDEMVAEVQKRLEAEGVNYIRFCEWLIAGDELVAPEGEPPDLRFLVTGDTHGTLEHRLTRLLSSDFWSPTLVKYRNWDEGEQMKDKEVDAMFPDDATRADLGERLCKHIGELPGKERNEMLKQIGVELNTSWMLNVAALPSAEMQKAAQVAGLEA